MVGGADLILICIYKGLAAAPTVPPVPGWYKYKGKRKKDYMEMFSIDSLQMRVAYLIFVKTITTAGCVKKLAICTIFQVEHQKTALHTV